MSNLCIIPARGNSQRIKNKNIKMFHGKPIISYSIEVAQESGLFDKIVVSTDSDEIAKVAIRYGAEVHKRDVLLSVDAVGTQAVAKEVLSQEDGFDYACVLYACSPLLDAEDLRRGLFYLREEDSFTFSIGDSPLCDAGNYYWGTTLSFMKGVKLFTQYSRMIPLPASRVCDINTMDDWIKAEKMYGELHGIS